MKDKLKIKIWNYKNIVLYEVLEQDKGLINVYKDFEASNGWKISAANSPSILPISKRLCIRGVDRQFDKYIDIIKTLTIEEAEQIVKEIKQAVKEFNESQREILDDEEKEYLRAVIKPFRKRTKYIKKVDADANQEFIKIKLEDDYVFLPYFDTNTMYKNMIADKEYTLEELGL